ncbi:hypothetical protein ACLX1H_004719 [Fusarium chlamydosporum]
MHVRVTNFWASLSMTAHLYNLHLIWETSYCFWHDMEQLLDMFGEEQFFLGGRPTTHGAACQRFIIQSGVSASSAAIDEQRQRKGQQFVSKAGIRNVNSLIPVHKSHSDWYQKNTIRMNWTTESIRQIVSHVVVKVENEEKEEGKMEVEKDDRPRPTVPNIHKKKRGKISGKDKNKASAPGKQFLISPTQLLGRLRDAMDLKIEELAFPYLRMHKYTWRMLQAMITLCNSTFKQEYGPDYLKDHRSLPYCMPGFIMGTVTYLDLLRRAAVALDGTDEPYVLSLDVCELHRQTGRDYTVTAEVDEALMSYTKRTHDWVSGLLKELTKMDIASQLLVN